MFSHLIIKIWIYINLWGTRLEKTDSEKLNISFIEVIANTFNLHDGQTGNANVIEVRQQPKGEFHSLVILIKLN